MAQETCRHSSEFFQSDAAKELAVGVSTNRALTSLNLSENYINAEGAKHVANAIKIHVSTLRFFWYHFELDLTSGSTAGVYGYSYYNTTKGALVKFDISNNALRAEGGKAFAEALNDNKIMSFIIYLMQ